VLLTRLPLGIATAFDLHVLGTPPALILSQDQTLHKYFMEPLIVGSQLSLTKLWTCLRDKSALHSRATLVIYCTIGLTSREKPVEPGFHIRPIKNLASKKKNALRRFVLSVGDPQTYALLHCSVFKERTPSPDPLRPPFDKLRMTLPNC
jgi:hypothetical protein